MSERRVREPAHRPAVEVTTSARPSAPRLTDGSCRALAQRRQVTDLFGPALRVADGPAGARGVVQRMLVPAPLAVTEADDQVHRNMDRLRDSDALEYRPGTIRSVLEGEVLHIAGHGEGGDGQKVAAFDQFNDAKDFVGWLMSEGLPEWVGGIQLHGCETAGFAAAAEQLLHEYRTRADPDARRVPVHGIPQAYFASLAGQLGSIDTKVHGPESEVRRTAKLGMHRDGFLDRVERKLLDEVTPLRSPESLRPKLIDAFAEYVKVLVKTTKPDPFALEGLGRLDEQIAKLKGAAQDDLEFAILEEAEDFLAMFKQRCDPFHESAARGPRRAAPPPLVLPVTHATADSDSDDPFASPTAKVKSNAQADDGWGAATLPDF